MMPHGAPTLGTEAQHPPLRCLRSPARTIPNDHIPHTSREGR
jgi:hypothetical protein